MKSLTVEEVHKLGDEELRQELEARGTPVGPISDFTRPLLVKILLRKLGLFGDAEEDGTRGDGWASQAVEADASTVADLDAPPVYAFFGVHLPPNCCDSHAPDSDLLPVYTDKVKCLAALKRHKGSRFKTFASYDEALQFSQLGPKLPQNGCSTDLVSEKADAVDSGASKAAVTLSLEKPCAFKGPSSQDRVLFRKTIERGDIQAFIEFVESNPRYLVSSSDSPAIVKEGSRYNALHVACLTGHHHICAQILRYISEEHLFHRLYPDDSPSTSTRRQQYLLDLYLNMPDKGLNETPLHIACKHGHTQCVKVLVSYAQCDKQRRNKYGETPHDVINQRGGRGASAKSPNSARAAIEELLEPQFYVPVLRDSSFTLPPVVGQVWSPTTANEQEFAGDVTSSSFAFLNVTGSDSLVNVSSLNCSLEADLQTATPRLHDAALPSPLTCSRKVEAFLGPLPLSKALSVRRRWRGSSRPSVPSTSRFDCSNLDDTSPISPHRPAFQNGAHSTPKRGALQTPPLRPATDVLASTPRHREVALPDYEKGLEIVGRRLAKEYNTSWFEYWDFLGEFVDCSTDEGKARLEEHLRAQYAKVVAEEQQLDVDELLGQFDDEGVVVSSRAAATEDGDLHTSVSTDPNLHTPVSASSASDRVTVVLARDTAAESPTEKKDETKNKNLNTSSSSLGSLCRGLEAIRLNASLSPPAGHFTPAAERRYNELLEMMHADESRLRDVITSIDTSHLDLTAEDLNASLCTDNWRLISYVAQSCKVTARTLSCVMQDMVLDLHHKMVPQLALVRMIKAKMAGEVLALHVLISRSCADDRNQKKSAKKRKHKGRKEVDCNNENDVVNGNLRDSVPCFDSDNSRRMEKHEISNGSHMSDDGEVNNEESNACVLERSIHESGVTFVHGLVVIEMVKQLSENLLPSELRSLVEILRVVVENTNYLEIASSDEDDEECDDRRGLYKREAKKPTNRRDQAQHIKCVVSLLERALALATNEGKEDSCSRIPAVIELPQCCCHWDNCCATLAALAEYAFKGPSSLKKCSNSGPGTKNAKNHANRPDSSGNNSMNISKVKYNKAHSFLHQTVFGDSSPSNSTPRRSPRLHKGSTEEVGERIPDRKESVVKTLNFDEENNVVKENEQVQTKEANDTQSQKTNSNNENETASKRQGFLPDGEQDQNNSNGVSEETSDDGETVASFSENNEDSGHVNDEEDVDGDDSDSFATAANTSIASSLATPDEAREVFINGTTPSKVDLDVLRAMAGPEATDVERLEECAAVDESKYPHLAQWQQLLQQKLRAQTSLSLEADSVSQKSLFDSPYCPKPRRLLRTTPSSSEFKPRSLSPL